MFLKNYFRIITCLLFLNFIIFNNCFSIEMRVKETHQLVEDIQNIIYESEAFPAIAHVIKIPLNKIEIRLIPGIGQRETVSSISKRANAFIAINGSNYRRGGCYNGNRVNLLYLNKQIYSDLQFARGSFGWKSAKSSAVIDNIFLDLNFSINNIKLPVTSINQPRVVGQSVLYTDVADTSLLAYTAGEIITINKDFIITNIDTKNPEKILPGEILYQVDNCPKFINIGMQAAYNFNIRSNQKDLTYNDYDFILGGAGLLIKNSELQVDKLYNEFSQGIEVVHCGDEIVADFHTRKMQEWLIELRHPRTAIGITYQNEICIVVVDGRQKHSEGFSLKELAEFMKQLNCKSALNIGGGGCSTLCISGQVINSPSGNEERPVSEALCFIIKK